MEINKWALFPWQRRHISTKIIYCYNQCDVYTAHKEKSMACRGQPSLGIDQNYLLL